jgi:hypothetical protein
MSVTIYKTTRHNISEVLHCTVYVHQATDREVYQARIERTGRNSPLITPLYVTSWGSLQQTSNLQSNAPIP